MNTPEYDDENHINTDQLTVMFDTDEYTLWDVKDYLNRRSMNPFLEAALHFLDCQTDVINKLQSKAGAAVALDTKTPIHLDASGGTTNQRKGTIAREASTSLFNNTNPWVATCGVCEQTQEVGTDTLALPPQMAARSWRDMERFGWVCPGCQKLMHKANT